MNRTERMILTVGGLLAVALIGLHTMGRTLEADDTTAATPLTVVVFGGHPDDPESAAGGLIATLTRGGHKVIAAYGTAFRGQRKFFDRPEAEVRRGEAVAACKVLGATPKFFNYAHEDLFADRGTLDEVSAWLDEVKPDIVITHWPLDMHPNHHVVSSLVWQCYRREGGWNLYFFEVMTGQQSLHFEPDLYFDIAAVRNAKRLALSMHKSQDPDAIWAAHEKMHRRRGAECGVAHAEAYILVEKKAGVPLLPVEFLAKSVSANQTGATGIGPGRTLPVNTDARQGQGKRIFRNRGTADVSRSAMLPGEPVLPLGVRPEPTAGVFPFQIAPKAVLWREGTGRPAS